MERSEPIETTSDETGSQMDNSSFSSNRCFSDGQTQTASDTTYRSDPFIPPAGKHLILGDSRHISNAQGLEFRGLSQCVPLAGQEREPNNPKNAVSKDCRSTSMVLF